MGKISFVYLRIFSAQNKQTRMSFANIRILMPYLSWAKNYDRNLPKKMSRNLGESYGKSESLNCVLYAFFILAEEAANLRVSVSLLSGQWVRGFGSGQGYLPVSVTRCCIIRGKCPARYPSSLWAMHKKCFLYFERFFFLEFYSFDRTIKRFSTLLEMGKGNRTKLMTFLWISGVLFSKQSGSVVPFKKLTGSAHPFPCPALFQVIISVQMALTVISQWNEHTVWRYD